MYTMNVDMSRAGTFLGVITWASLPLSPTHPFEGPRYPPTTRSSIGVDARGDDPPGGDRLVWTRLQPLQRAPT